MGSAGVGGPRLDWDAQEETWEMDMCRRKSRNFLGRCLLPPCQGLAGSRAPGSGDVIAVMGTVGGMDHVSGDREGAFFTC